MRVRDWRPRRFIRSYLNGGIFVLATAGVLGAGSCATVPKEVVRLSQGVGEDIAAVQVSYRALIREHFAGLRAEVNTVIDTRWKPVYLREYIQSGKLVELATASDPSEALGGVEDWVDVALEEIAAKRRSLLGPIERQEDTLLTTVDEAFAQLLRANSVITAHLQSLRKVEEAQDRTLEQMRLRSLRDRINAGLVAASDSTESALERLERERKRLEAAIPARAGRRR